MKHIKKFSDHVTEARSKQEPWWKEYTKYELSAYPVNIPKDKVTIDLTGDIDTHPVMTWYSPTTGKKVYSYTKTRMEEQKKKKYSRIGELTDAEVERIKAKCHEDILSRDTSDSAKEAAAIVCIISQTGLRPGSRKGFLETKNRGVMTLAKNNVKVDGPMITFDFIGKSYQENEALVEDGVLANYIQTRMKGRKSDFLFDISKDTVENYYKNTLNMGKFKIKDLRTYIAGQVAKWFLENDKSTPPPVPNDPKEIKKAVKAKLKKTFEYVSNKLNNTPAMAKNSYVSPVIINDWLAEIGVKSAVVMEDTESVNDEPDDFVGNAPLYDMPTWWDDDDVELVKEK